MNDKLRIGILGLAGKPIPTIAGDISAPQFVVANLAESLKKIGHKVIVFTGKDSQVQAEKKSADLDSPWKLFGPENEHPISFTERKVEFDLILSQQAITLYKNGGLDIINSHDIRFSPYLFLEAEVPVLYTPHYELKTRFSSYDQYRYNLMRNPLFGLANISRANIQFSENLGLKIFGYVPNGIDIEKYHFNDQNREGILLVGRMAAGKKIKEAIEIAKQIGEKIVLIGPPGNKDEDIPYFEDLKKNYLNRSHVKYLGYLSPEEIIPYYQKAKVLLFPSHSEGLPISILEAMATGLPVVASAVGGIPDIINDKTDGCLLNNDSEWLDKIKLAMSIKNELPRKKIENQFTLEKSTQRYLEAYEKFINATGKK